MRFLMVWPAPGVLGGVETLIARMSRWLIANGHEVSILMEKGDNWIDTLPSQARCIVLGDRFPALFYYFQAKKIWHSLDLPAPDIIKSFNMNSSWIASQLAAIIGNDCRVLAGMYGSFFFKWYYAPHTLGRWAARWIYLDNYLNDLPASARIVCGTDQVEDLEEVHGRRCLLWPTPIDTTVFQPAVRLPKPGKIVSIGRVDVMKQYNLYMVDVLKELRRRGLEVSWSVYGTGSYTEEMKRLIAQEGLQSIVSLEGTVPYPKFWQALSDAYVFVGMGTALLEAALFRVPNVMAIAYDKEALTYGPVYNYPLGSMAPSLKTPPKLRVADEIERIMRLDAPGYEREADTVYQHVQPHCIDVSMNQLLELARRVPVARPSKNLYVRNYFYWFMRKGMKVFFPETSVGHPPAPLYSGSRILPVARKVAK